ncbi:MAG TPA: hypothetical protein EYG92_05005 [Lutibacter sp.]|nr:hypothetical protein [Lutibacter sp.]
MAKLPNYAQFSPIHSFSFIDIDKDGQNEIIAVGNEFEAEVETQRYDASYGTVIKYNKGNFTCLPATKSGLSTSGNAKQSTIITNKKGIKYLLVTNNNSEIDIFKIE